MDKISNFRLEPRQLRYDDKRQRYNVGWVHRSLVSKISIQIRYIGSIYFNKQLSDHVSLLFMLNGILERCLPLLHNWKRFLKAVSRCKRPIRKHLSTPFRVCFTWSHDTQYSVTKVTSNDVTMMTPWWNTFEMLRMSKKAWHITSHMTSSANEKGPFLDICNFFSNLTLLTYS